MKTILPPFAKIVLLLSIFCFTVNHAISTPIVISGGSDNDIIGRTCRMPNGNLISIIERNPGWVSGDLYATFSSDDGETWSEITPVVIDAGNQSSFSLVVSPDDSLVLFYASNENGYYKIYSISSIDGIIWSNKQQIDLGWTSSQQIYDPMVILEEDHSLTMVYIRLGGGAYIANCPYNGNWDTDKTLVQSGAYRARVCKNGDNYLVAYHRNISGNYDIHIKNSKDRVNWSPEIDITSNGNSHDAYCNITPDGEYILYYAKHFLSSYNICQQRSEDGLNWSQEKTITMETTNDTQPSFFAEGENIYLTWTHAIDYDNDNDIYFEKFDYITSINNHDKLLNPNIFFDNLSGNIVIENIPSKEKAIIIVSDLSGRKHFSEPFFDKKNILIRSSNHLKSGMYIVNLYIGNQKYSKKIVVIN